APFCVAVMRASNLAQKLAKIASKRSSTCSAASPSDSLGRKPLAGRSGTGQIHCGCPPLHQRLLSLMSASA
ncbi:Hypothetical predicted protein, partial [Pelobates cultripes]